MVAERIKLESMLNTRDLGSLVNKDGVRIRSRKLIRSGELSRSCLEDIKTLYHSYDLRQVIDLRGADEMVERPDKSYRNIINVPLSAMPQRASGVSRDKKFEDELKELETTSGPQAARVRMRGFYRMMVSSEYCLQQYHRFIDLLLANKDHATLWHCAVGKDRAGIGAMNVELLLGVSRDDIIADYMFTNECYFPGTQPRESVFDYYNFAFREYIDMAFSTIDEVFGDTDTYIREGLKISKEKHDEFRKAFLEV